MQRRHASRNDETVLREQDDCFEPIPIFAEAVFLALEIVQKEIKERIQVAKVDFRKRICQHDLDVLCSDNSAIPQNSTNKNLVRYGTKWMKQNGYSPDTYVQIAIQLAGSRLFHNIDLHSTHVNQHTDAEKHRQKPYQLVATYKATHTRQFKHGRTDTTRSVSKECAEFCKVMNDRKYSQNNDITSSCKNDNLDHVQPKLEDNELICLRHLLKRACIVHAARINT